MHKAYGPLLSVMFLKLTGLNKIYLSLHIVPDIRSTCQGHHQGSKLIILPWRCSHSLEFFPTFLYELYTCSTPCSCFLILFQHKPGLHRGAGTSDHQSSSPSY